MSPDPVLARTSESSSRASADHGSASAAPTSTRNATGDSFSSVVAAMDLHNSPSITMLQRWATGASESQFNALSGALGGLTSGIVTCPLDVIKTKLQAQGGFMTITKGRHVSHHKVYEGLTGTAKVIWKDEGIRGLYRGLGPIILGYLPTWAVWFTVYNKSKVFLAEKELVRNQNIINFWSSIVAGASSTIVTNPIWVIKTRLMSQSSAGHGAPVSAFPRPGSTPTSRPSNNSPWHYNSTLDAARKMYSSEGIFSFYSGLSPALLGLTHVAVQFPVYEYLRIKFTGQGMGEMGKDESEQRHWMGLLSASVVSKILASSATYPHEVIRTRLQTQRRPVAGMEYFPGLDPKDASNAKAVPPAPKYRGVLMTFRTILLEEGWRAFYAGMGVNMMRAVPAATVTMMTYEFVMQHLHAAKAEGRRRKGLPNDSEPRDP